MHDPRNHSQPSHTSALAKQRFPSHSHHLPPPRTCAHTRRSSRVTSGGAATIHSSLVRQLDARKHRPHNHPRATLPPAADAVMRALRSDSPGIPAKARILHDWVVSPTTRSFTRAPCLDVVVHRADARTHVHDMRARHSRLSSSRGVTTCAAPRAAPSRCSRSSRKAIGTSSFKDGR